MSNGCVQCIPEAHNDRVSGADWRRFDALVCDHVENHVHFSQVRMPGHIEVSCLEQQQQHQQQQQQQQKACDKGGDTKQRVRPEKGANDICAQRSTD